MCALPQQADTGTLQFALSLNGIDFVATPLEFTRYARPTVSMVTPAAGAIVQESRLVLHGSGFGGGTSYTCRFDGAAVAANLLDDERVSCVAPVKAAPTSLTVELSLNGVHFTTNGFGFTYFTASALEPQACLLYTSPSPRDGLLSRMPSSA